MNALSTKKSREIPHGQRECVNCTFYHPERKKVCSAFGTLENKNKDCSLYIDTGRDETCTQQEICQTM